MIEGEAVKLLADIRDLILAEHNPEGAFVSRWLGPSCTDPAEIPELVKAHIFYTKEISALGLKL